MCLVALALDAHARYPLVIAANRDEFFARPTAALAWWEPTPEGPLVLGGRDLEAGGTWLGLTTAGRLALLTNIRDPSRQDPTAPSRGRIVTDWLGSEVGIDAFWKQVQPRAHNGFNLIAADVAAGQWFSATSASAVPQRLGPGLYGLSNAKLDTPWPKLVTLRQRLGQALEWADSLDALSSALFDALADRSLADDAALPRTGIPLALERQLSSAFVDMPERGYGTRCSTLVITERVAHGHLRTHVLERTHGGTPDAEGPPLRREVMDRWPALKPTEADERGIAMAANEGRSIQAGGVGDPR